MRVVFVGGFLGSGKTTAIAGACRALREKGSRVAVVTNDQGKLQVDALFLRSQGAPVVEVSGGCFCCRYDDFDASVAALAERERPDVVFAESVGSCADIVATVIKPFESFREMHGAGSSLSVFADSRLLLAKIQGKRLPFSEDLLYVFDRQLAEADLIVLNKRDLLSAFDVDSLRDGVRTAYPGIPAILISAREGEGTAAWLEASLAPGLRGGLARSGGALDIDYGRYGSGELELAWLDERLRLEDRAGLASGGERCRAGALAFASALARALAGQGIAVGHVKLQVSAEGYERKAGFAAADLMEGPEAAIRELEAQLPPFRARHATVSVNARVQCSPGELSRAATAAAAQARALGLDAVEEDRSAFRPGRPEPTHRMG
jgi:Ni2+-binding GTPase involved in maturation of urease and hydrogenase